MREVREGNCVRFYADEGKRLFSGGLDRRYYILGRPDCVSDEFGIRMWPAPESVDEGALDIHPTRPGARIGVGMVVEAASMEEAIAIMLPALRTALSKRWAEEGPR